MMCFVFLLLAVLYVLSPYDLIPDIICGLGWIDDAVILFFLLRYLFKFRLGSRVALHTFDIKDSKKYFDILGIEVSSNSDIIKSAYRKLAKRYHPDKVAFMGNEYREIAEDRFRKIKEAYDKLKIMGRV